LAPHARAPRHFPRDPTLTKEPKAPSLLGSLFPHILTDKFDDPSLPGEIKVTITFRPAVVGTELFIEQKDVPDVIPAAACYLGWQESLDKLKRLVEPEIPD
jgi:hypothetical protein